MGRETHGATDRLSDTYRQQSNLRPETRETDPSNRWLASQNPRRLEAEFVRDNALFISGLLNPELGGPPVFPYQPRDTTRTSSSPTATTYRVPATSSSGVVCTHWQRTFLNRCWPTSMRRRGRNARPAARCPTRLSRR